MKCKPFGDFVIKENSVGIITKMCLRCGCEELIIHVHPGKKHYECEKERKERMSLTHTDTFTNMVSSKGGCYE